MMGQSLSASPPACFTGMNLLETFVAPLHRADIAYFIVGSVASIQYGEPRFTADVDLAVSLQPTDCRTLEALFPSPAFYCPPIEVMTVECQRQERGHFNIIEIATGLKAVIYPCRTQPLFTWAMANRRQLEIDGMDFWFAPPEYVIVWKLLFHREGGSEKHLRDISSMLATSSDLIDRAFLEEAIRELGLEKSWIATQAG